MKKATAPALGFRIGQARRELGVRLGRDVLQADVAGALGVGAATVSRWESDDAVPRDAALAELAAYLGVSPAYLRYGVGAEVPQMTAPRKLTDEEIAAAQARVAARRVAEGTSGEPPPRPPRGSGGATGKRRRPKPR